MFSEGTIYGSVKEWLRGSLISYTKISFAPPHLLYLNNCRTNLCCKHQATLQVILHAIVLRRQSITRKMPQGIPAPNRLLDLLSLNGKVVVVTGASGPRG